MNEEKFRTVLNEVIAKTRSGKIEWEPTATADTYIAAVGGEFSFVLRDQTTLSAEGRGFPYSLEIIDSRDRVVSTITGIEGAATMELLRELSVTIQRRVSHSDKDEKIDQLIGVLSRI